MHDRSEPYFPSSPAQGAARHADKRRGRRTHGRRRHHPAAAGQPRGPGAARADGRLSQRRTDRRTDRRARRRKRPRHAGGAGAAVRRATISSAVGRAASRWRRTPCDWCLRDMLGALLRHGATRLIVVNGHGGNAQAIHDVTQTILLERGVLIPSFYPLADRGRAAARAGRRRDRRAVRRPWRRPGGQRGDAPVSVADAPRPPAGRTAARAQRRRPRGHRFRRPHASATRHSATRRSVFRLNLGPVRSRATRRSVRRKPARGSPSGWSALGAAFVAHLHQAER